jgi:hypothetical protein
LIVTLRKRGQLLRGIGAHGKGLVACLSIHLQVTAFDRLILLEGGQVHARNFGAQFEVGLPGAFLKP